MVKRGDTPGCPRLKPSQRYNTVTFIQVDGGAFLPSISQVRVWAVGQVKVKLCRPVRGTVKQFSITRQRRRWFVNVICTDVPAQIRPPTGAVFGLGRGVTHLLADSDGGFVPNPHHIRSNEERLTTVQRDLVCKKRRSKRRHKAAARVDA